MDLSINTTQVDASVALKAYQLYKSAQYKEAIPVLLDILDVEPRNWHARLFLAACYFKTGQPLASERAFRFTYENCTDEVLTQKACLALQAVKASTASTGPQVPAEFSGLGDRIKSPSACIDSIIG